MKFLISLFIGIWMFLRKIESRVEKLILKMISLSFLTWCFIFYYWQKGNINMNSSDFLIFTVAVIGIKSYKSAKEKIEGLT